MPSLGSRSTNGDFNASTHPWCANTYFVTSQRYLWTAGLAPPSAKLPAGLLQGFGFLLLSGLLAASPGNYRTAFAIAILPGLVAAALIAIVVQERARSPVSHAFFSERLGLLPSAPPTPAVGRWHFRRGCVRPHALDPFSHATTNTKSGRVRSGNRRGSPYVLHNVFYARFSYLGRPPGGSLSLKSIAGAGYALARLMAFGIIFLPVGLGPPRL